MNITLEAPLESASRPKIPEPAKRSKTTKPSTSFRLSKIDFLTIAVVGLTKSFFTPEGLQFFGGR